MQQLTKKNQFLFLVGVCFLSFMVACEGDTAAVAPSETSFILSVEGESLTVKVDEIPLREVLEELARQADLKVYIEGSVADEVVSVEFQNIPFEEGIRRILTGKSYALTYVQVPSSNGNLAFQKVVEIKVAPSGAGPSKAKASGDSAMATSGGDTREEQPRSLEELMWEATEAPDPKAREAALEALSDRDEEEEVLSIISTALQDENPHVRQVALRMLEDEVAGPVPFGTIAEVALMDTSPRLRMEALELMADTGEEAALELLKRALQDSDPRVSGLARQLLEDLKEGEE